MKWTGKSLAFSLLPTVALLACAEGLTRAALSCAGGTVKPLYYGLPELHRFLFEDKREIVRRQGTFYVEPEGIDPGAFDLTRGAIVRGRYYPFKQSPGSIRILVLGASSAYGVTGPAAHAFPAYLEHFLNDAAGRSRFEVLNMAVPGVDSAYLRTVRQPEGFRFEHDMELFYCLHNDLFKPAVLESRPQWLAYRTHHALSRLSAFYASLERLLLTLTARGFTTETASRLARQFCDNMEAMVQACRARGIAGVIVPEAVDIDYISTTASWYRTFLVTYRKTVLALEEMARRSGMEVIDAQGPLYETQPPSQLRRLFYDEVHLTSEGNAALARLIAQRLVALRSEWFR
jgi:lysophospholipase L1-like esterase